jgi:putative ABC transport system substrate-binding protein
MSMDLLERRRFLVVAGAVLVGAVPAKAQRAKGVPRIGILTLGVAPASPFAEAFRQGLRQHGYVEGRNIVFEFRFAEGKLDALPAFAAGLVKLKVDVIVTESTAAAISAKKATQEIPIVMAATALDPVKLGLVASLNRPGGNVTGLLLFGTRITTKRMQLFRDAVPDRKLVAVLYNAASPNAAEYVAHTQEAARALGFDVRFVEVRSPTDLDAGFEAVERLRPSAFFTLADGMLLGQRTRIVEFALRHKLPGVFAERQFADAGALMSYGPNIAANFRRAADYVDKILKGARPADLPVEEPPKIDFLINVKTAQALGLTVAPTILMLADEVIR